jgi:hypothetical protein
MGVGKKPKIKILKFLKNAGPTTMQNCGISKIEDGEFIPFNKSIMFKFFWLKKKEKEGNFLE